MSLLAEVAARAGVPVEGVVRVVTRQPVSRRIEQRVVDVLDSLEPEQLRMLERLARAGSPEVVSPSPELRPARMDDKPANVSGDALTLRLAMLLEEVAVCLNQLRREQLADRQDRVDDLAVLVDLMTTGWRGVDRRLARIERSVARLEPAREAPARPVAPLPRPPQVPEQAAPPPEPESKPESEARPLPARRRVWRRRLAPVAPVLFVAGLVLALLAFELFASPTDAPRLESPDALRAPPRSLSSTTGGVPTPTPASTPRVLVWPGRPGVAYYLVRVLRGRTVVYEARPTTPRAVVPKSVTLTPGIYRWSVRAGVGAPAKNRLGGTIVASTFVVTG